MAGLTNVAFRELAAEYGGFGLMFTEMCSAKALPAENPRVSSVFGWRGPELPYLVCQIFGADRAVMARAAKRIESEGFFGVDINMGCSVAAICKQGAGAALLRVPGRAAELVAEVRQAVTIPVSVKFRTGWSDSPRPALELAGRLAEAGADAFVFHPRVAPDRRSRPPKWSHIQAVKEAVGIPVFGNGEVFSEHDCVRMIETTGCDGVAIGRMALARPWIFAQWARGFEPGGDIYQKCAHRMLELLEKHFEPINALRRYKKWIGYFAANFTYGHGFASRVGRAADIAEARKTVENFFCTDPARNTFPNMNLFI
ncbi:MAG: tRNA-dihydrouridine synthase family protein [Desulfobacteraceae bacterium]|nr:tRNA-dihydrouridine synthase family protein [Desulfobacteraceae bacterium]